MCRSTTRSGAGTSKFKFVKDAYRYILQVLRMVMYFNPLKALIAAGVDAADGPGSSRASWTSRSHPVRLATNTVLVFLTGLIIGSLALAGPTLIVRSRPD